MVDSAVLPQLGTHFLHLVDQLLRLALELLNLSVLGLVDFLDSLGLELQFFVLDLKLVEGLSFCLLYTSPSPRDLSTSRMPSSA